MKKQLPLLLFFIVIFHHCFSQPGKVYDNLSMPSKILKMERKYAVYLPPGYETSERSYPVLYLLHGGGDDQTGWVQFGEVDRKSTRLNSSHGYISYAVFCLKKKICINQE